MKIPTPCVTREFNGSATLLTWVASGLLVTAAGPLAAAPEDSPPNDGLPVRTLLKPAEVQQGWIMLFDGQTPFGWKVDGAASVENGKFKVSGTSATLTTTTTFGYFELTIDVRGSRGRDAELVLNGHAYPLRVTPRSSVQSWKVEPTSDGYLVREDKLLGKSVRHQGASRTPIAIRVPAGIEVEFAAVNLRPLNLGSIFNGKDLTGWNALGGAACERCKSVFSVTEKGELNVTDGPGDLQTEGQYQDFIAQLEVISNGNHLNSGIFFRSLPGQFWQGYEAQIRNQWEGSDQPATAPAPGAKPIKQGDRAKPVDFGTGGIYNRQPARAVVSDDHEWFTYTIAADGPHIALWVNGYQTADFVDDQSPADSARRGKYLGKGTLSVQGHDPTTDLNFRNIRIAELPERGGGHVAETK